MTTEKTTIPDLSDASIIARRYIEAATSKSIKKLLINLKKNCGGNYWKSVL